MRTEIYWINDLPHGRLAIMPRPRAGDWLADEVQKWWRNGVDMVVSLLTPPEIRELELQQERPLCARFRLDFVSHPIRDRDVPHSMVQTAALASTLNSYLLNGAGIAIHCRMGLGRSALLAALMMSYQGLTVERSFALIEQARGLAVPDTAAQREWVHTAARLNLVQAKY